MRQVHSNSWSARSEIWMLFTTGPHVHWFPIWVFPQNLWRQVSRGASKTWRSNLEGWRRCGMQEWVIHWPSCLSTNWMYDWLFKLLFGCLIDQQIYVKIWMDEYSPNHACWSPCTSIASPKSANLTAAPFSLLANRRFSGWGGRSQKG